MSNNQIKYRVWDKYENKYFKPIYEAYRGKLEYLFLGQSGDVCLVRMKSNRQLETIHESSLDNIFVIQFFTTVKDSFGTDIYAGDYLEVEGNTNKIRYEVKFDKGEFCLYSLKLIGIESENLKWGSISVLHEKLDKLGLKIKVVGNINEN